MEGQAISNPYAGMEIWAFITIVWIGLTWLVLRQLRRVGGWARFVLFILGALMTAVLIMPVWFYIALLLFTLGSSSNPEGPVGAGGPALVSAIAMGVIGGLIIATVVNAKRHREGVTP